MSLADLQQLGFDVKTTNHAAAVLTMDFGSETQRLCERLQRFQIPCSEMIKSGGGESSITERLRNELNQLGWIDRKIDISKSVGGTVRSSRTHEIDHVLDCECGTLALEIEWNNKDPFFDRDLENFQRLHAEGVISVGIVVTRGSSLQNERFRILSDCAEVHHLDSIDDFDRLGIKRPTANQLSALERKIKESSFTLAVASMLGAKYGTSTTHWDKLQERLSRGVGNPCPLLLIGIPASRVTIG